MQVLAALCFLVLAHLPPLRGEVVGSFQNISECLDFFYNRTVPELGAANPNAVHLCQRFNKSYHFATLYDTYRRIPVYSAYRFQPSDRGGREERWFVEPQLVHQNWSVEMHTPGEYLGERQALFGDYSNSGFDRGHLNPNGHHAGDSRNATFTLTNVVPQTPSLNQRAWNKYETYLQKNLKKCAQAYVLVGAIPSANNWIIKNKTKRVNIPDRIWNAYCCLDNNDRPICSGGAIALNTNKTRVRKYTLSKLKTLLSKYTKSPVGELFRNNC